MKIHAPKNTVVCKEGDTDKSLYFILEGKLLVCSRKDHMVTPIAYLKEDEFFGEMSFFDHLPRSADVISVEDSSYLKIEQVEMDKEFPPWLLAIAKNLTKDIRHYDEVIRDHGIKRSQKQAITPLSFEEQKLFHQLLTTKK